MKKLICCILALVMACGCAAGMVETVAEEKETVPDTRIMDNTENEITEEKNMQSNPVATITMEDGGVIHVELYPAKAENTVRNFISLANSGYYDGLIFHRVIAGFMIQGGDPTGTGMGGPGYSIKGEFSDNGYKQNDISHERGVISMARSRMADSAGSQFFIMHATSTYLDGQYAAFGMVTDGMDVVDKIAATKTDYNDRPYEEQRIATIRVETFGVEYPAPEHAN